MTLAELLARLRELDVRLWLDGERLRFSAPEGVMTPELRAELSQHKSELLDLLRRAPTTPQPSADAIPLVARDQSLPLSFTQERLWFLDQLEPGNIAYNIPAAVRLQGTLDVSALERCLSEIVRRHEALRTTFALRNEQPVQLIAPPAPVPLPCSDLSDLGQPDRETRARRLIEDDAQRPFDLARGPLLRYTLLRLADRDHVLLINLHHIISDGWSTGVLLRELITLYRAFSQGQPSPLPDLPVQYADFAAWQRQWLSGETLQRQLAYWRDQFSGELPTLDLPADRPRPPVQTFHGATHNFTVPSALAAQLQTLSHTHGATLFMTLLAAFQTLLYRCTGQPDLIVGTPIANRTRLETELLIGFFVNTLALRINLSGDLTFTDLLVRVRDVTLGAYAHQDLPFDRLVDELRVPRDLSRTPLFHVMFAVQNAPLPTVDLPGLQLQPLAADNATAKFDLTLFLTETPDGLAGQLEYNTDLFEPATIARLATHYHTLLAGIAADPQQCLAALPLLTAAERRHILIDWNDTALPYPAERGLHQLFEAQAAQTPEAIAVICDEQQLTYRELNERATQLAQHLRRWGAEPEVLISLCVERSVEMIVGLLGILKTGSAYVPLDPAYPPERLAFILEDTRSPILLTQAALLDRLPAPAAHVFCLDRDWPTLAAVDPQQPPVPVNAQNLAYLIYTSGSTGRPKGVAIEHRQAVAFIHWAHRHFARADFDGVLAATSICFDLSIFEIFATLSCGGAIILAQNALHLPQLPARERVTLINTVPSAIKELLRSGGIPDSVHSINLAGEPLPQSIVEQLYQRPTIQHVFDLYGPSETTTYSTCARRQVGGRATIGRPIGNTHIYLLDAHWQPVPIGIPGEVFIGGSGLARGYLQRPELTAERFIPNPFGADSGERLYRTGDLARYLPDGQLEFLGRSDHQVKVRGFRIELGEIETRLQQHPRVQQALVMARAAAGGDQQLIAYVVSADQQSVTPAELRQFLQAKLPDYLIPAVFVQLEALPLTPNGKIDRRALPAPDLIAVAREAYTAPRTPVEQQLADIWADVLHVPQLSVHANFFTVGGHSLLATQIISRLKRVLHVDLPLRALFEAPTIAALAARLETLPRAAATPIVPVPLERPSQLPLSFAQERLWFLDQLASGNNAYNIPSAVRLCGALNVIALENSLNEIVRRHEALRTTFEVRDGQPFQVIAPAAPLPLTDIDLSDIGQPDRDTRAQRLMAEAAQQPFDLSVGPLARALLLRLAADEHILLITLHHIISDGWSTGVLLRELTALYHAFSQGQPSPLTELPLQYADFAVWQRQWLSGDTLQQQLAYWRDQFSGELLTLDLPADRPRPPVQTFHGAAHNFNVLPELTAQLQTVSRAHGATLFMTLLAAFQTLLYRYTGQTDLIVGTPIANRNRLETESLIGFFVNTLALRVNLNGDLAFIDLLARVREVTLGAYAHQDLPFDRLVQELQLDRDLSRTPLFQVVFTLQNAPLPDAALPGLTLTALEADTHTAKFDLTLSLLETPDGLLGSVEYNTDLFDQATITRLAEHYQILLTGIAADPQQHLSALPLLSAAERHLVVQEWNDRARQTPPTGLIPQRVTAQAAHTPEALAVACGDQALTYRELDHAAQQIAQHLRQLGVGPEVIVGVCLNRSVEMPLAALAVLQAGGAYLPLDPAYPPERLAYMLNDSGARVLITQPELLPLFPNTSAHIVTLPLTATPTDDDWREPEVCDHHLAYVIYTSGSTGKPKGVMIQHRSLLNLVQWHQRAFDLAPTDRATQLAGWSFDASVWEIWPYLACGASLHLPDDETRLSPEQLQAWLLEQRITLGFVPTPLAEEMLALPWPSASAYRLMLTGGDQLQQRPAPDLPFELINNYGPTESTVVATSTLINSAETAERVPAIGWPIANTQVYLLDAQLNPVPIGVPGEVFIGGAGVARGYLRRPELTAECFIPDSFSAEPGARLYRTGDLARYRPDGQIEFLGRLDQQVKVRGFRIELGEIEALLKQHPAVQQAVVIARAVNDADQQLVAYYVPRDVAPEVSELRACLRAQLPDYMIPAAFVMLDALPLTPNGKLDRRALPAPEFAASTASVIAPRDAVELQLLRIWQDVLDVNDIGIRHNFFEVGGHSLRAIQLLARIQHELGVQLPVAALFQSATVEQLALLVRQRAAPSGDASLVLLQRGAANRRPLFLVHPSGGHVLCYVDLVRALGPEQPCYGLQSRGLDDDRALADSIAAMAQHYIDLLQTIQPIGPYRLGGWSLGGVIAFEMAQQLTAQGHTIEMLALIDSYAPAPAAQLDDEISLLGAFAFDLGATWQTMPFDPEHLQHLPPAERLAYLWEQARQADVIPAEIDLDRMRQLYRVFQSNVTALQRYTPRPYAGPIVLFTATDHFDEEAADAARTWQPFVADNLIAHEIPGYHYTVLREPGVTRLAAQLSAQLQTAPSEAH